MKNFGIVLILLMVAQLSIGQGIQLDLKVFLEGPFFNDHMTNELNQNGNLPLEQPYDISPWNYLTAETVSAIPSTDVIDWVLVDILLDNGSSGSSRFDVIKTRTGFVLANGNVVDLDGNSNLTFPDLLEDSFHVQLHHRNHLPVISKFPLPSVDGVYTYDFTINPFLVIGEGSSLKQVSAGVYCLYSADGDANNQIDNRDKNSAWLDQNGLSGYLQADYNMDGSVTAEDITSKWSLNVGQGNNRTQGILKVCDENGRYFCNGDQPVYLTGSHTWDNLQDIGEVDFNYTDYLDWMENLKHNFIRLWAWENFKGTDWASTNDLDISPLPYLKTGNQYDVTQLNQDYFERLKLRIQQAAERDIYVAIMFFEGFSAEHTPIAWNYHPFKSGNNVNGIAAERYMVHTNVDPDVLEAQKLYVREVIDIVNYFGLTNVLYEIGNEIPYTPDSDQWQNDMIDFIHDYEYQTYGVNRPVGKTYQNDGGDNSTLFNSPADWISPNSEGGFDCRDGDAPIANGDKVIISDTDHYYYIWYSNFGHPIDFVWKSFTGGINPIHMDNWGGGSNQPGRLLGQTDPALYNYVRYNMGFSREMAERIDLLQTIPQPTLSSTGFCLASESEFVVYYPENVSSATIDLSSFLGQLSVEWLNAQTAEVITQTPISGGSVQTINSPFSEYSVLLLKPVE